MSRSVSVPEEILQNDLQPVPLDVRQWDQGCPHVGIGKIVRQVFHQLEGQGSINTFFDGLGRVQKCHIRHH
jgi:hypothetical protein